MYFQDFDERTPRAVNNASSFARHTIPITPSVLGDNAFQSGDASVGRPEGFLYPYLKNDAVWRCPQDNVNYAAGKLNTNNSLGVANATCHHLSLFLTGSQLDGTAETTSGDGTSIAAVSQVSQIILVSDGDASDGTNIENNTTIGGALIGEQFYTRHSDHTQANRHAGIGNYLMVDGHVKTLPSAGASPEEIDDDPRHPCPNCADRVDPNAQVFFNLIQ